jgi:ectoine hydroxylase-related dioxygenase (phytanoyl-CoA dioxygenase family)
MANDFYGAIPQTVLASDVDRNLEELAIIGYTVIENVVPVDELAVLRTKLDRAHEAQRAEATAAGFELESIQEENQVRAPLCYDDHFLEMARHPRVIDVVRRVLGNYFLIHLQIGIINQPATQNRQSVWHRDLLYHDFVISKPLAVSVMVCIDDFKIETGGTKVIPHTHKIERMPSPEFISRHAVTIDAKAGSVFLMDSMLLHMAGFNSSAAIRRGLNTIYASGLLKQQVSFQAQLDGKHRDDPFLNMLLGYDAEASASVLEWRKRRHRKLYPGVDQLDPSAKTR